MSCASPSVVEVGESLAPFQETLSESADSAVVFDVFRWGQSDDTQVWLVEEPERDAEPIALEQMALWDSAQTQDGTTYVATDAGLWVVDREFFHTPIDDGLGERVLSLNAWDDALWLEGETETLVVLDGAVSAVSIEGETLTGPVFQGDQPGEVWALRDGLQRLRWQGDNPKVLETAPTQWARWATQSAGSTMWAARGKEVSIRGEDGWSRFLVPDRVLGLHGHVDSEVVWLRTEGDWLVWRGTSVRPVEGLDVDTTVWGVDPLGRMLVSRDGALVRLGAEYSAAVKGLEADSRLDVEVYAQVIPSFPEDVLAVEAWLNGEIVEGDESGISVEPVSLGDGAHEFRASVTYSDESTVDVFVPFTVGEFESPTWEDDIRPIFKADCGMCHDGDSESVFNTAESWRERIDDIVQYVSTGAMPLERDPLTPDEVAVIRAWRATGMLP